MVLAKDIADRRALTRDALRQFLLALGISVEMSSQETAAKAGLQGTTRGSCPTSSGCVVAYGRGHPWNDDDRRPSRPWRAVQHQSPRETGGNRSSTPRGPEDHVRRSSPDTTSVRDRPAADARELERTQHGADERRSWSQTTRLLPRPPGSRDDEPPPGTSPCPCVTALRLKGPRRVVETSLRSLAIAGKGPAFYRVSPLERPDPGHPRVDLGPPPVPFKPPGPPRGPNYGSVTMSAASTELNLVMPTPTIALSPVGEEAELAPFEDQIEAVAGMEGTRAATVVVLGQVPSPAVASTGPSGTAGAGGGRDDARFDPPSVWNGLKGLTKEHVDKILLCADKATRETRSCSRDSEEKGGAGAQEEMALAPRDLEERESPAMVRRVIRAPPSVNTLPRDRRNRCVSQGGLYG